MPANIRQILSNNYLIYLELSKYPDFRKLPITEIDIKKVEKGSGNPTVWLEKIEPSTKTIKQQHAQQAATRQHAKKDAKQRTLFVETHVTGYTSSCLIVFAVPSAIGGPAFATQRKKYQM
jgi:hypothetical protein